jgi:hypothetical protein
MPRFSNSILLLVLILLFSLGAIPTYADGMNGPIYSITGVMDFTGNNTCTPAPCSELVAFSFDVGYNGAEFGYTEYSAYVFNATAIWTGDIASFTGTGGGPIGQQVPGFQSFCAGGDSNYIEFHDGAGDEADVHLCQDLEPTPVVPSLSSTDIYRCNTNTCANDFGPGLGPEILFAPGTLEDVRVTPLAQVPEPSTLMLLAGGLLALIIGTSHRKFLT